MRPSPRTDATVSTPAPDAALPRHAASANPPPPPAAGARQPVPQQRRPATDPGGYPPPPGGYPPATPTRANTTHGSPQEPRGFGWLAAPGRRGDTGGPSPRGVAAGRATPVPFAPPPLDPAGVLRPPGLVEDTHEFAVVDPASAQQPCPDPVLEAALAAPVEVLALSVVNRLFDMNVKHAHNAWYSRRRDPLSPYALAFFFYDPVRTDGNAGVELRTAVRPFFAGDAGTLPELLYSLTAVLPKALAPEPTVSAIATRADAMSPAARYLGVGVSSLDTPDATWAQVQKTALNDMDVAGRCYALIRDDWRLRLDRYASRRYGRTATLTTRTIPDVVGQINRRWVRDTHHELTDPADDTDAATWTCLADLHATLRGAFNAA